MNYVRVDENGFTVYTCPRCGSVSHPSIGCQYSQNIVYCRNCAVRAFQWVERYTNSKEGILTVKADEVVSFFMTMYEREEMIQIVAQAIEESRNQEKTVYLSGEAGISIETVYRELYKVCDADFSDKDNNHIFYGYDINHENKLWCVSVNKF